ncbi:hypothetical protein HDV02_004706 [Globomyces sp. JEL0801]|nr:hypothetical protein HDV02_004706 [Globomyces sp. JEL0801]
MGNSDLTPPSTTPSSPLSKPSKDSAIAVSKLPLPSSPRSLNMRLVKSMPSLRDSFNNSSLEPRKGNDCLATSFTNLYKLMDIELNVIGQSLITNRRIYIREDYAVDLDGKRQRLLLFNDLLICGPTFPIIPKSVLYKSQKIIPFVTPFGIHKQSQAGICIVSKSFAPLDLVFDDEESRDAWYNTVNTAINAYHDGQNSHSGSDLECSSVRDSEVAASIRSDINPFRIVPWVPDNEVIICWLD